VDVEKTASVRDRCPRTLSILPLTSLHDVQKEQGLLQGRTSALELKYSELQTSNRDLMEDLERGKRSLQQQQFAEEKKQMAFEAAEKELKTLLEESKKKASDLAAENEKLQREVAAAKATPPPPPSPPKDSVVGPDVVATLRADITRLQNEKEELIRESKTIEERYKNSRLVCLPAPPP